MSPTDIPAYLCRNRNRPPLSPTGVTKEIYLDMIETALGSYSDDRLTQWLEQTKQTGIQEHGFIRVAALMGIMIAKGRMQSRKDLFLSYMSFCCDTMAQGKNGNDFGVKEILYTLRELKGKVPQALYDRWLAGMAAINPYENYTCLAKDETHCPGNWAVFNMAGEAVRSAMGLCDSTQYLNRQLTSQLTRFDENGCYRDPHEPILYDVITRNQFSVLLFEGYHGPYAAGIDQQLIKGELFSLMSQSACFQLPYGGRSNQMMFNEPALAACFEYAAHRYQKQGNPDLAGMFKRAARLAVLSVSRWLEPSPAKHVKNGFPWNSVFGIDGYGYYDKYMITMGSNAYMAYLFADDTVEERLCPAEIGGYVLASSPCFHKIFAAAGSYSLEFDTKGDRSYEATGLGRIHKTGVPSETLLSLSFASHPGFCITEDCLTGFEDLQLNWKNLPKAVNPSAFSLCGSITTPDGKSVAVCDTDPDGLSHRLEITEETEEQVSFSLTYESCAFPCPLREDYILNRDGVHITLSASLPADYSLEYLVPLIITDGTAKSRVKITPNRLHLSYRGHEGIITHNGTAYDTGKDYRNRNGIYRGFRIAAGAQPLTLHIQMT